MPPNYSLSTFLNRPCFDREEASCAVMASPKHRSVVELGNAGIGAVAAREGRSASPRLARATCREIADWAFAKGEKFLVLEGCGR
jgi:hypothetical protein